MSADQFINPVLCSYAASVLSMLQATGDPCPFLQPLMEKYASQDANFTKF